MALGTLTTPDTKAYWGQVQWDRQEVLGYPASWKNRCAYCMLREDYEELLEDLRLRGKKENGSDEDNGVSSILASIISLLPGL